MKCLVLGAWCLMASVLFGASDPKSEITVDLKLDELSYVAGERIRGVVNVVNMSPGVVKVGASSKDRFRIEIYRAFDRTQLEPFSDRPMVADFDLNPNEGQRLEVFLGDSYGLRVEGSYQAVPVLIHNGIRYEGQKRGFDVVPGIEIGGATQIFSNHDGLRREFRLLTWNRGGHGHLFVAAFDSGTSDAHPWNTVDLGEYMKITKPTISILKSGEVIVLHRLDPDNFIRSEFWSVGDGIEWVRREIVQDPETAGTNRVRELYKQSGGIKAKENPWWKFW